jgi:hypothetical protein
MSRYAREDEERVRTQTLVREWARSGLLDSAQRSRMEADLRVGLRRTNALLRGGLAFFTALLVGAAVLLYAELFAITSDLAIAVSAGVGAICCFALAEWLVASFRLYRYGVEEALAASAVVLASLGAVVWASTLPGGRTGNVPALIGLAVASAGGFAVYRRFGFVYAAVGAMLFAALLPFEWHLSAAFARAAAAAVFAAFALAWRATRVRLRDDFPGDDYGVLQAAAFVCAYLTINLQLFFIWRVFWSEPPVPRSFYWTTYAMTWAIPAAALALGIRDRDRPLVDVGAVLALATLVTNKPYLRWPRHTWDPIILGAVLIAVALAVRRWLASGRGGERQGWTAIALMRSDRDRLVIVGTASAAFQPVPAAPSGAPPSSDFTGGRSGGGGAGGSF